jgi:hypothetical protein
MPPTLEEGVEDEYHGDIIVVKGEYPAWSRISSPSSMSPEIDVANLLAQINAPQNLDYPQQLEGGNTNSLPSPDHRPQPRTTRTPKTGQKVVISTMEDRLMAMPEKRPLPWRDGVEAGAENETGGESRRKQIRFGCLLATRGDIQENPCMSCANGRGKFRVCVALDGYFKGACASCQLSGRPNRCSIKKGDGEYFLQTSTSLLTRLPDDPESPIVHTPGGQESSMISTQQQQQQTPVATSSVPKSKRRKVDPKPQKGKTAAEEKIPEWESARPQWEQELGDAHARQQLNEIVQRPWAPVNDNMGLNGINVIRTIPQEHRNSMGGWAAVNQPAPSTTSQAFGIIPAESSSSFRQSKDQGRREDTFLNEDGAVALIDTLPKSKQRQVYGLVSGLQNGIQGLQRELDSLKKALGIDEG